jgi:hypothetical protein
MVRAERTLNGKTSSEERFYISSRVRLTEARLIDLENLALLPSAKIGQTEHVGCLAVLGRTAI